MDKKEKYEKSIGSIISSFSASYNPDDKNDNKFSGDFNFSTTKIKKISVITENGKSEYHVGNLKVSVDNKEVKIFVY